MARSGRNQRLPVVEELQQAGYAFDFFQAVRLLETMRPEAVPIGTGADPSLEAIRFRSDPTLSFPASEVLDVSLPDGEDDGPAEVLVSFLGLAGSQGPLPRPFTELLLDRLAAGDTATRDFLDIFNHRLVSLLYRAKEKHRVGMRIQSPEKSRVADMGLSLIGMGADALRDRMDVADRSLLFYAGTLSHSRRTAVGLEGLLSDYFAHALQPDPGRPTGRIRVREFIGRWHELGEDQGTVLGMRDGRCVLGVDAVMGGRVWDQQGMIEIVVGPVDFDAFERFLPGGDSLGPLTDMVSWYLRDDLDFAVRLILEREQVPGTVLTTGSTSSRLGLTSWLKTRDFAEDADDVILGWPLGMGTRTHAPSETGARS
ncbi:MAG: type VI secretion system baseplate subunit TssG [Gemmatimonadales bacterium]|jgi:type VI secretion system protein ImpH|nr:type VI secretion system baseplate subunit TssG [Gemmatimonadales bacterium]MBT3497303.1 type VI secretion system baseplate subunit TssG [Gemmatimonadales bacterium]MBT3774770.1 type VI secretion system baseplate subunit TssG [Gemmatimonadales bacterium]MBT3957799.1 type VI secretion system baseplate subunit TssG [Gemmatimonadales bacterium]MBT4437691.1 type VI secretion system baseplate subunit TssG [Gemmatimonadales bacterium]